VLFVRVRARDNMPVVTVLTLGLHFNRVRALVVRSGLGWLGLFRGYGHDNVTSTNTGLVTVLTTVTWI
jgi:hypothetical protein